MIILDIVPPNTIVEADLHTEVGWQYAQLSQKAIKALERNNIPAEFVSDRKEALKRVAEIIPDGSTIGIGDSVTLHQIGLFQWLDKQDFKVYNPFARYPDGHLLVTGKERFELMRKAMVADVYITGTNALTLDGKLVNVDGHGNRVAPLIFGPSQSLVIVGANKIVKDEEEALNRIRRIAAPINANRHFQKHFMKELKELPCMQAGTCVSCHSKNKICRKISIIDGQSPSFMLPGELGLKVLIVGEPLGI